MTYACVYLDATSVCFLSMPKLDLDLVLFVVVTLVGFTLLLNPNPGDEVGSIGG